MNAEPLHGKRIAITRAEEQAGGLAEHLRTLGAEPVLCPAIAFAPPADFTAFDAAIAQLAGYDWLIATSVNGVRALFDRIAALSADASPIAQMNIGAIGPATAEALAEHGFQAQFVPSAYVAEAILAEIGDVAGKRILLPRADIAREALATGLRERGATVDEIAAYRTVPGDGARLLAGQLTANTIDAISFTSSSTVRYLLDGFAEQGIERSAARKLLNRAAIVCIGPITAATARAEGLRVDAEAREFTADGVVAALVEWFAEPAHA